MVEYWLTIGIVALVGVLLGAATSIWATSRDIRHKSVIESRQNWRDSIRELVPRLVVTEDATLRTQIRHERVLRLNPNDRADIEAVASIDRFVSQPSIENGYSAIEHFQEMLKLEWEKAKIEASLWPFYAKGRASARVEQQVDEVWRESSG